MAAQVPRSESGWMFALAGIISILFGLAAIVWPSLALFMLILLFGAFAIVDGVLRLINMVREMSAHRTWWPDLIIGIAGVVAGLYVLLNPGISATVLAFVIAFWAIIVGLMEIVAGLATAQFLVLIVGVISVVFGFVLLSNPLAGALALVLVIGVFAIVRGLVLLFHAFSAPGVPAAPA